jgi:hypothetical protein
MDLLKTTSYKHQVGLPKFKNIDTLPNPDSSESSTVANKIAKVDDSVVEPVRFESTNKGWGRIMSYY